MPDVGTTRRQDSASCAEGAGIENRAGQYLRCPASFSSTNGLFSLELEVEQLQKGIRDCPAAAGFWA